jgi:phasin family protein
MASKIVKKKASPKAVAEPAAKVVAAASSEAPAKVASSAAKPKQASSKSTSVVPFNPMGSTLNGMANPDFSKFKQSIPSFDGSFVNMETTMNNFKNQYEKMTGDASSTVREGVETFSKSGATFAKGAEQILKTIAEVAQESSQRNAEAVKALMASRTLNEFAEAQNKLAQQNFDDAMSTMTKLSEMTIKLCSEAFEPINGQMTKAMTSAMNAAKKNAA